MASIELMASSNSSEQREMASSNMRRRRATQNLARSLSVISHLYSLTLSRVLQSFRWSVLESIPTICSGRRLLFLHLLRLPWLLLLLTTIPCPWKTLIASPTTRRWCLMQNQSLFCTQRCQRKMYLSKREVPHHLVDILHPSKGMLLARTSL
ncbi:hypothetical protein HYC85_025735 [Camellia sinensis]|uniref:Uncharacterized protein n=1 Tax=Camellia sinensis TaxID=4442 RepID=A0A7J7GBT9_CAMSI|nr:hypothetical protein HYC85_025735 [Camellia sinensis]